MLKVGDTILDSEGREHTVMAISEKEIATVAKDDGVDFWLWNAESGQEVRCGLSVRLVCVNVGF